MARRSGGVVRRRSFVSFLRLPSFEDPNAPSFVPGEGGWRVTSVGWKGSRLGALTRNPRTGHKPVELPAPLSFSLLRLSVRAGPGRVGGGRDEEKSRGDPSGGPVHGLGRGAREDSFPVRTHPGVVPHDLDPYFPVVTISHNCFTEGLRSTMRITVHV